MRGNGERACRPGFLGFAGFQAGWPVGGFQVSPVTPGFPGGPSKASPGGCGDTCSMPRPAELVGTYTEQLESPFVPTQRRAPRGAANQARQLSAALPPRWGQTRAAQHRRGVAMPLPWPWRIVINRRGVQAPDGSAPDTPRARSSPVQHRLAMVDVATGLRRFQLPASAAGGDGLVRRRSTVAPWVGGSIRLSAYSGRPCAGRNVPHADAPSRTDAGATAYKVHVRTHVVRRRNSRDRASASSPYPRRVLPVSAPAPAAGLRLLGWPRHRTQHRPLLRLGTQPGRM